mmetsp:Transcript_14652/g.30074  ORF Transcript_14652/g.30074 Transcript_14652/m.30074 type:complete len:215 (-) Transcript_14652:109-753(-)
MSHLLELLLPLHSLLLELLTLLDKPLVGLKLGRFELLDLGLGSHVNLTDLMLKILCSLLPLLLHQEDLVDLSGLVPIPHLQILLVILDLLGVRGGSQLVHGKIVVGKGALEVAHLHQRGFVLPLELGVLASVPLHLVHVSLDLPYLLGNVSNFGPKEADVEGRILHLAPGPRRSFHSGNAGVRDGTVGHLNVVLWDESCLGTSGSSRDCAGLHP